MTETTEIRVTLADGEWRMTPNWHGWSKSPEPGARALHIGPMPGRKSICLSESDGTSSTVLAYFRDEASAEKAMALLDWLLEPKMGDEVER